VHLGALPAGRPDAEHRLVDDLAALTRIAEDHFQRVKHQLGSARSPLSDGEDVILDVRRSNRLELPSIEDREVPERLTAACQRRWSYALAVPLEPALNELGERQRLRRIERAERDPAVDLVSQELGVPIPDWNIGGH
jgi:hypothetical protein